MARQPSPPGWYPDPQDATTDRYWSGLAWSGETRPRVTGPAFPTPPPSPTDGHFSVDGRSWWNGVAWCQVSEDRRWAWDGSRWHPLTASEPQPSESPDVLTPPAEDNEALGAVVVIDHPTESDSWIVNESNVPVTVAGKDLFGTFTVDLAPRERTQIASDVDVMPFYRGGYSYDDLRYRIGQNEQWAVRRGAGDFVMALVGDGEPSPDQQGSDAGSSDQSTTTIDPEAAGDPLLGDMNPSKMTFEGFLTTHEPTSPVTDLKEMIEIWMTEAPPAGDRDGLVGLLNEFVDLSHLSWTKGPPYRILATLETCMNTDVNRGEALYEVFGVDHTQNYGDIRFSGVPPFWKNYGVQDSVIEICVHGFLHVLAKASDTDFYYQAHR